MKTREDFHETVDELQKIVLRDRPPPSSSTPPALYHESGRRERDGSSNTVMTQDELKRLLLKLRNGYDEMVVLMNIYLGPIEKEKNACKKQPTDT